ncbi:MAG: hypothetical protein OXG87_18115 [Gemmatimonadetes bacterium]|nr:hypothetical protein [Gemmatimonadota bacterium]
MSAIALNNRVTSDSDAAFASCTALPVHQTTLNVEEMAGIDGLWDWGDFASEIVEGAIVGAVAGGVTGVGIGVGAVGGAIAGACTYAFEDMVTDD